MCAIAGLNDESSSDSSLSSSSSSSSTATPALADAGSFSAKKQREKVRRRETWEKIRRRHSACKRSQSRRNHTKDKEIVSYVLKKTHFNKDVFFISVSSITHEKTTFKKIAMLIFRTCIFTVFLFNDSILIS